MALNMATDDSRTSRTDQQRLWEMARDTSFSPFGGANPRGWTATLNELGIGPYELVSIPTFEGALDVAAEAIRATKRPVGLVMWRGRHAWVMSGFESTADPRAFDDFDVTGIRVLDPLYPHGSSVWGRSPKPNTPRLARDARQAVRPARQHAREPRRAARLPARPARRRGLTAIVSARPRRAATATPSSRATPRRDRIAASPRSLRSSPTPRSTTACVRPGRSAHERSKYGDEFITHEFDEAIAIQQAIVDGAEKLTNRALARRSRRRSIKTCPPSTTRRFLKELRRLGEEARRDRQGRGCRPWPQGVDGRDGRRVPPRRPASRTRPTPS